MMHQDKTCVFSESTTVQSSAYARLIPYNGKRITVLFSNPPFFSRLGGRARIKFVPHAFP